MYTTVESKPSQVEPHKPFTDHLVLVIYEQNPASAFLGDYLDESLGDGIPGVQWR